jgi:2'-5' RNA ligase
VYSVNVPVPSEVTRLAVGLASTCLTADQRRGHTLVAKRLPDERFESMARRARDALEGTPPFAAKVTGIDLFRDPPSGKAPVAYLVVESPELYRIHRELCAVFDPVEGFEGDEYDPHVTIARGGDAANLLQEDVEPFEWTVERLAFWHPGRELEVETVALPA